MRNVIRDNRTKKLIMLFNYKLLAIYLSLEKWICIVGPPRFQLFHNSIFPNPSQRIVAMSSNIKVFILNQTESTISCRNTMNIEYPSHNKLI